MRPLRAALLPALALSALVACSGDEQPGDAASASSATPSEERPSTSAPSSSPDDPSGSPGEASPGQVPRPEQGSCEPVAESPDGRYVVADAGELTLRMESGSLQLDLSSSGGWSTSVDSDDDEADVEFRRGDEHLELEADVEDGRLVLQICDRS